ncbi:MAG: hypothetical protein P4N41_15475 [Negativicutes bacterium]|nr:hypothetical protein [Negativicutes bacterium]
MSAIDEKKAAAEDDVNNVVDRVSEVVDKYNSLLRMNELFIGFVREMQLEDELLAYLQRQGLPPKIFS